jgi:hypothetical protein
MTVTAHILNLLHRLVDGKPMDTYEDDARQLVRSRMISCAGAADVIWLVNLETFMTTTLKARPRK